MLRNSVQPEIFTYSEKTSDILVEATPLYIPENSNEENSNYFFAYQIKITNFRENPVTLLRRHWIIKDGNGVVQYINGVGVVGETPKIDPGKTFSYSSFCSLNTITGNMRGNYLFLDESGERLTIHIPLFFLRHPKTFLRQTNLEHSPN